MHKLLLPSPGRAQAQPTVTMAVTGLILSTLLLTGCGSMEVLDATESPEASVPPQDDSGVDATTEPVLIEVSAAGIDLLGASGELVDTFGYFEDESQEAIESLTDLFDEKPTVTQRDSKSHSREVTDVTWPGFTIRNFGMAGASPDEPAFSIVVTSNEVDGIAIETNDAVRIGATEEEVADAAYADFDTEYNERELVIYRLDEDLLPEGEVTYLEDGPAAYSITAWVFEDAGVVSRITAPETNFGD